MKKSAFTLIELLVVITIIAILMAIALPVYSGIQERARVTQDASNLRQIGIALITYLSDRDDIMPKDSDSAWKALNPLAGGEGGEDGEGGEGGGGTVVAPVFKSPFDNDNRGEGSALSYGFNGMALGGDLADAESVSALLMVAPRPEASGNDIKFSGTFSSPSVWDSIPAVTPPLGTHNNHRRINALFGDGHTENLAWRDFAGGTDKDKKRRWTQLNTN